MFGRKTATALGLAAALASSGARAIEGPVPQGVPHLDHVFVIVMASHGFSQIADNPFAPFINDWMTHASVATNYFAIAHPALTNHLEIVGGSNFGVQSDNYPDWHNTACIPNLVAGTVNTHTPSSPAVCPIAGIGTDAATPIVDTTNAAEGPPGDISIDGTQSIPAATNISGKTIADQAVAHGLGWKSYQESLSFTGPDQVNFGDGVFDNTTPYNLLTGVTPPLSSANVVALYTARHNPFVYFRNIQDNGNGDRDHDRDDALSYGNIAPFDGDRGLYADLASGNVPAYSFIVPNQCNDMHGRGNGSAFCGNDPNANGTQTGLNPALIYQGDVAVEKLYRAIKASLAWQRGRNAIVLVFDQNDYAAAPANNRVLLLVDKNYGSSAVRSSAFYTHFSLLKSIEAGLRLPCLNHACDSNVAVMSDLFAE